MEVAASLVTSAASVTVIGKDPVPFFASLGEQVSSLSNLFLHLKIIFNSSSLKTASHKTSPVSQLIFLT